MKTRIKFVALIFIAHSALCQNDPTTLSNIAPLYRIADTVNQDYNSVTIKVLWMDSVVEIVKTTRLKYDLDEARKFRRDPTFVPTQADTITYNELKRIGAQNCHSYALEKYFAFHNLVDKELFTNMTVVTQNRYMGNILSTSFRKVTSISTTPRRNLKHGFTKGSILVFRNKWNVPIHTVFYDGEFHSKYGGWAAKAEKNLKPVFDRYWDTTTIEEYQFDLERVNAYLARTEK